RASHSCLAEGQVIKPTAALDHPLTTVQIGSDVFNVIVQRAFPGDVELLISVTPPFQFAEQPPLEPSIRIAIVLCDDVTDAHQYATTISENGVDGAAGIVRSCVPISSNQRR